MTGLRQFFSFSAKKAGGDSTGQGLRWEKQVALYISGQQQWLCSDQKASGGGAHTAILCLVFVFNINTSDLLYFDIMLLKTPDLCNLRTFVAIFFSLAIYAHFPPIFGGKKTESANLSTFRMYGHTGQEEGETISHLLTRASVFLQKGLSALLLNSIPGYPAPAIGGVEYWSSDLIAKK